MAKRSDRLQANLRIQAGGEGCERFNRRAIAHEPECADGFVPNLG
jgi:hypothetical protein